MKINVSRLRRFHRSLAPIMLLPILLTLTTGSLYQMLEILHKDDGFGWLIAWHKGRFGPLNLEKIYPFLNAAGLLFLALSGIYLWWTMRRTTRPRAEI